MQTWDYNRDIVELVQRGVTEKDPAVIVFKKKKI